MKELPEVTRVEVIDYTLQDSNRAYVKWDESIMVHTDIQDGGKTIKIFIDRKPAKNNSTPTKKNVDLSNIIDSDIDFIHRELTGMPKEEKKTKEFVNIAYVAKDNDVLNYVTRTSSQYQRDKLAIGEIYINAAVCLICHDYIRSKNRHDFVTCSCGDLSVDGGSWYAKRVSKSGKYVDIIENFYDAVL